MNKSEAGKLGAIKSKETRTKLKSERIEKYNLHPATCKYCGKSLSYEKRKREFCNQSCAASYNNHYTKIKNDHYYCLNCGKELTSKHRRVKKYCNNKCQSDHRYKQYIMDWKKGRVNGLSNYSISRHIRRYLLEKVEYKCQKCGWSRINPYTGQYVLEVHHKDGDYSNNNEDNLEVLCPNCHAMTGTYKSHNKLGRKNRRKYS